MTSNVNPSSFFCRLATAWGLVLLFGLIASTATGQVLRPEFYGFVPAYPATLPDSSIQAFEFISPVPWESRLTFDIDSTGRVLGVTADSTLDSTVLAAIRDRLLAMAFHPGTVDSVPRSQELTALFVRIPRRRMFSLRFPLDTAGILFDHDLYQRTAAANGFVGASIKRFPSYYSTFRKGDTLTMYPYILLRLQLDTLGQVREVAVVRSTHPGYTQQLASAAYWAKFNPARAGGKAVPSVNWLLVSFFPLAQYPTAVLTPKSRGKLPLLDQLALRMYADTLGLLSAPVPRGMKECQVVAPNVSRTAPGWVEAQIVVDTLGQGSLLISGEQRRTLLNDLHEVLKSLRFFPAVDFAGRRSEYTGFIRCRFDGSTEIRIECAWLPVVPVAAKKVNGK